MKSRTTVFDPNIAFAHFVETWCGGHGDEQIPEVNDPFQLLWQCRSGKYHDDTWSISINSIVWPVLVYLEAGQYRVAEKIGSICKTTTKLWHFSTDDEIYDYGEYRFVRFQIPSKVSGYFADTGGFFVQTSDIYKTSLRLRGIARSGKQITQTVEVASSSSKSGKKWEVMIYTDGTASCNCPSWIYQMHPLGKECKHTRKVLDQIQGTP